MASKTTNYNLDMPGYNEIADIDVINGNMDKIDVQMKKNADSAQQSKDIVSDKYSATNTYAVGDYCIHENILYKCKTAITTGEEFDSNKWVQTTCGTEFRELNSNLDGLEFSEIAGGKNLFDGKIIVGEGSYAYFELPKSNVHISISDRDINVDISNIYFGLSNAVVPNYDTMIWAFVNNGTIVGRDSNDFINSSFTAKSLSIYPNDANTVTKILQRFNIQIEEGTTATPYEPYIPSVKMLSEEVNQQKNDLGGLSLSASGTTLSITDGTNTWTLEAN